ncbi:unnamed protein product [Urochloa humidicola]
MAEVLAGLLTSAIVGIAKDKLASAIKEPASLLWNFSNDLEDMNSMLESISAALHDAERRSAMEKLVQLWLKRLKHAAMDISDMLQDYQDTSDKLSAKKPGVLSSLSVARKKIAVANRMKRMKEELRKINRDFHDFNFSGSSTSTSVEQHDDVRETSSRLPEKQIIGRNGEKQEIINLLSAGANNDETVIVAIYGLGGMGKSTLAQLVYNDAQFKKYDHRIWVYVSRDFSLKKIGSSIISLIPIEGAGGHQNRDTLEEINQCLDNLLRDKKVLIVLDDLWEEMDYKLGKLRSMLHVGMKGSMIDVIVTTRNENIARKVSTYKPYKLQPLKDYMCWEIIKRYISFEDQHNQEGLEKIGLDIAKKCGGVALAAQALGYMLQSKDLSGWTEINNSGIWNESSEEDYVLPSLKLSYERMPPRLRICFSYCSIFPKGHNIAEDDLIRQWIALDFIKPLQGKEYIRQLLGMSFLQVSKLPLTSQKHMARYTMHDLVHDLARLIMGDELIVSFAAPKGNTHGQKYSRYASITKYHQPMKLSNIMPSKVRALHFSDYGKLDLACGAFSFAKCLHILDFSGCSSILLPSFIGQLKQLKYLTAPRMQNECLPEYITELPKLQYLNLDGSSQIFALPESISKLRCLEYLGLSGCSCISKLPESFGDLKCMIHLDMSGCFGIRELPNSLGNLTNLQRIDLSECSNLKMIPESLCAVTQLQYLNLSSCRYIAKLPEAIGNLVDLQYLNLSQSVVRELPESFKRLRSLLHLDLEYSSIKKGLPRALRGLTALQYLDMSEYSRANMEKDDLPVAMTSLTNLKVLDLACSLHGYFDVENNDGYLDFICTLTNLEHLDLSRNALGYLPENIGNLKRLHALNLQMNFVLKSLPESIGGVPGLKSVLLNGCSQELMDQASSLLHYSLTLPLFKVRPDNVRGHSNLHLLEDDNPVELDIVSLENVRFVEEAQRLKMLTKQNLLSLKLAWTPGAYRHLVDRDLLGQLVPPLSLQDLSIRGYSSPSIPSWFMAISDHLPNLTNIEIVDLPTCAKIPPLGQLPYLEKLYLSRLHSITKIDRGICGGKGAFPRLAEFKVASMEGLEEWYTTYPGKDGVEEFMFPMLDKLYIYYCPRLRLKPCPPKCRVFDIVDSDQVISSLEELQTSSHRGSSTLTTSLAIIDSKRHSWNLFHDFPALEELDFWRCTHMACLLEGMLQLSSLETLRLDMCDSISALPEWLGSISSLKNLDFWGCTSIKSLPACIQKLTKLQKLRIRRNQELQQWCESEENKAKLAHIHIIAYE